MSRICCCEHCVPPKRYPGCHDHCEEYQTQKAEHDRIKSIEKANREKEDDLNKYDIHKAERLKKRFGKCK